MSLIRIEAPAGAVLGLTRVKQHLRVEHTDDDALIQGLIDAATELLDGASGWLGRALAPQSWRYAVAGFPCPNLREIARLGSRAYAIRLPLAPVSAVSSLRYTALDGSDTLLDAAAWRLLQPESGNGRAYLLPLYDAQWPSDARCDLDSVRIEFSCGYAPQNASPVDYGSGVPAPIRHAMLLLIGQWYDNRADIGNGTELPNASRALLANYRLMEM